MPSLFNIVSRFCNDSILYWEKNGDDPFGKPLYATPVERTVRWEDRDIEVILPDGRTVLARAYILSAVSLVVGSVVWKGTLASWEASAYYPSRPTVNQGCFEIIKANTTPGITQLPGQVFEVYL